MIFKISLSLKFCESSRSLKTYLLFCLKSKIHFLFQGTFTKCVHSLLDWGSAAIATAATAITSSLLSSSPSSASVTTEKCCSSKSLNPNAKEFKPLNPNAKEFIPEASNAIQVPEQKSNLESESRLCGSKSSPEPKKSSPKLSLRTVAQRKCTPWIPPGSSLGSLDDFELPRGEISDSEDDSDEDPENDSKRHRRARLLSQCSEDGFITFEEQSPKVLKKIDTQKCSQFLKDFLAGNESDEEILEDDSDEDWDYGNDSVDENLLEECGLKCQFMIPMTSTTGQALPMSTSDQGLPMTSTINVQAKDKFQDTFPIDFDHDQVLAKIRIANETWDSFEAVTDDKLEKVKFDLENFEIFEEDPDQAEDLRSARMGVNYAQLRADRDRYDRILGPIFDQEHRDKMRSYIQNQKYLSNETNSR